VSKKKKRKPADWEEAKRRCRLNDDDIRMAKELGMAAGSLIKNIPAPGQMWKLPVKEWVRELYQEKFSRASRERDPTYGGDSEFEVLRFDEPDELAAPQEAPGKGPDREELRIAGVYVARDLSLLPEVVRVVLFGSAVDFSSDKAKQRIGVDLAVWLTDLGRLKALQNARGEALNRLSTRRDIRLEAFQVAVHILEPGSDRYRGRLCNFGTCPERYMDDCRVDGCGAQPFLRQLKDYRHDREGFAVADREILFERPKTGAMPEILHAGGPDEEAARIFGEQLYWEDYWDRNHDETVGKPKRGKPTTTPATAPGKSANSFVEGITDDDVPF
jgi:hypothetical protein